MNNTWKSALPVAAICAVLVAAFLVVQSLWLKKRVLIDLRTQQRLEMASMRVAQQEQLDAMTEKLAARIDQTTRAVDAAITGGAGDLFVADGETKVIESETINALADAIILRLNPMIPTSEDQERGYADVSERVSTRLNPILGEIARTGNLTRSDIEFYSNQISAMLETALAEEQDEKQRLNNAVIDSSAIAEDSYRLAQEMSALYLSSLKDEGVLSRILSLPVGLVQDVSTLSIVGSSERKEVEERLFNDLTAIETRLDEMRAELPENELAEKKYEVVSPVADEATDGESAEPVTPVRAKPTAPSSN